MGVGWGGINFSFEQVITAKWGVSKNNIVVANIVDPDKTPHYEPSY